MEGCVCTCLSGMRIGGYRGGVGGMWGNFEVVCL